MILPLPGGAGVEIRAIESCETSGILVSDHFREITKMIDKRPLCSYNEGASISCDDDVVERDFCEKRKLN